ncbi:TetR/AcrR family transcriptional regulator [Isoptericola sp. BMS4]|uniref:TetR/AcrR family transcriptional regulator n=1 Tax=Isoptericola sp. BMS4 TaxID=2527875 RepID=UPI00196A9BE3|nr:TetR family transcriptional regulator [Isoptericola sp. BMS4]
MRHDVVDDAQNGTTAVPRALRQDAGRNRRRLLGAAREAFRERGLDATVRHVALRAGVSVATFHRRFDGRDALVTDVAEQTVDELSTAFADLAETAPADDALERALRIVAAEQVATRACAPDHRERFPQEARALDEVLHRELYRLLAGAQDEGRVVAALTRQDLRLATTAVAAAAEAEAEAGRAGQAAQRTVTHFMRSFRGPRAR